MPSSTLTPSLWETVKCDFKSLFPEDVFQMWFEPMTCLDATEDSVVLGVPNDLPRDTASASNSLTNVAKSLTAGASWAEPATCAIA